MLYVFFDFKPIDVFTQSHHCGPFPIESYHFHIMNFSYDFHAQLSLRHTNTQLPSFNQPIQDGDTFFFLFVTQSHKITLCEMFFHIPFFNLLLNIAFTHKYGVKDLGGPLRHLPLVFLLLT